MKRLLVILALTFFSGCTEAGPTTFKSNDPSAPKGASVSVLFAGDTSFGENYQREYEQRGKGNILEAEGYDHGLRRLAPLLAEANLAIVNLETPITNLDDSPFEGEKSYVHWADVQETPCTLAAHGIRVVSLANNHALDFGVPGLEQTLESLAGHGIQAFGAGRTESEAGEPYISEFALGSNRLRLVILGGFEFRKHYDEDYNFYARGQRGGTNAWTSETAAAQIKGVRQADPNAFVVAFPHWGTNYMWRTRAQVKMAHAIVDAGADLVLGHGAHMLQELELYQGKWIVYGLGNFIFHSRGRYQENGVDAFSLVARLDVADFDGALQTILRLYPIACDNQVTNYQSYPVRQGEFQELSSLLLHRSPRRAILHDNWKASTDELGMRFLWTTL